MPLQYSYSAVDLVADEAVRGEDVRAFVSHERRRIQDALCAWPNLLLGRTTVLGRRRVGRTGKVEQRRPLGLVSGSTRDEKGQRVITGPVWMWSLHE